MSYVIEEESGTCTGRRHRHNGYYAGDFSRTPVRSVQRPAQQARTATATRPAPALRAA